MDGATSKPTTASGLARSLVVVLAAHIVRVLRAKNQLSERLFAIAGVHGVEVGSNARGFCVRVLVDEASPETAEQVRAVFSDPVSVAVPFEVEEMPRAELQRVDT
ncbi:Hypothetical protein UVM_LOCUS418 [uncultured virus]|nr:Hypothetical protein UVM_LOCUS418 [uncultured virus]